MCYTIAACLPFEPLEKCMTFKDIFRGLSRTRVIFQDFPGPGIFKKKPRLSRRRGNPVIMLKRDILKICEKFISVSDISAVIYLFIYLSVTYAVFNI